MSRFIVLKTVLATLCFLISNLVLANSFATPEEAVNSYITGVKTGSGEHVLAAFSESASIQYYDEEGKFNDYTRDAFAKLVDTGNQWNAKIQITDMKRTNKAANATVEFTWGENGKKGYVDYLNLIHNGESWQISDKVAHFIER
ncbi:MAG: hypothetical protein Alis3KO_09710 [Aliiglaciecola sp.]